MDGWMDSSARGLKDGRYSSRIASCWLVGCGFTYSLTCRTSHESTHTCIHTCTHTHILVHEIDGSMDRWEDDICGGRADRWTGGSVCGWRTRLRADHADGRVSVDGWMDGSLVCLNQPMAMISMSISVCERVREREREREREMAQESLSTNLSRQARERERPTLTGRAGNRQTERPPGPGPPHT